MTPKWAPVSAAYRPIATEDDKTFGGNAQEHQLVFNGVIATPTSHDPLHTQRRDNLVRCPIADEASGPQPHR